MAPWQAKMPWRKLALVSPLEVLRRGGHLSDAQFDALYPTWVQDLSETFWTPVAVARRAAELLITHPGARLLDVGSGAGKFCLVAGSRGEGIIHGIEQRLELVTLSRQIAADFDLKLEFLHGNMLDLDWDGYDGIYLYNPFSEQTSGPWCQIDDTLSYSKETQGRYVQGVVGKLDGTRPGTRVATYFGFGGALPKSFRKIAYEHHDKGPLEVWVKE